jgi:hypothetical protein
MSTGFDSDQINKLIADKQIEQAKAILRQSSDPAARSWLVRLEQSYPTVSQSPFKSLSGSGGSAAYSGTPERGGCLTAWLGLATIANPLLLLYYLSDGARIARLLHLPGWGMPAILVMIVGIIICIFGLWNWKIWGVYGYIGIGILTFFINLILLGFTPATIGGLLGIGLFWYLVHNKIESFA